MPCYVDSLQTYSHGRGFWRGRPSCHLIADTQDELHAFALSLGCRRSWFQNDSSIPHYDLDELRRRRAVKLGALEIDRKELVRRIRQHRASLQQSIIALRPNEGR